MKFIVEIVGNALKQSHPARGAWIEIPALAAGAYCPAVAPRKGCVD